MVVFRSIDGSWKKNDHSSKTPRPDVFLMKGRLEIKIKSNFSAHHQLRINGREEKPHTHNWVIEAVFCVPQPCEQTLKRDLETQMRREISVLDGRNLGDIEPFRALPASAENLAFALFSRFRRSIAGLPAQVSRVTVEETPRCRASFIPSEEP
jgi:6-pyruvoyl-tetrahydropterin synthase